MIDNILCAGVCIAIICFVAGWLTGQYQASRTIGRACHSPPKDPYADIWRQVDEEQQR